MDVRGFPYTYRMPRRHFAFAPVWCNQLHRLAILLSLPSAKLGVYLEVDAGCQSWRDVGYEGILTHIGLVADVVQGFDCDKTGRLLLLLLPLLLLLLALLV